MKNIFSVEMMKRKRADPAGNKGSGEKPFSRIMIHSFVVVPFLIAVSCVLLFAAVHLLTRERQTAHDLLEDIKIGGVTKRWQAAFELSRILANQNLIPHDERFPQEMIRAFRQSKHDDHRVRQYLALAMGRTGNAVFFDALTEDIGHETEESLDAVIYAIGMLRDQRGTPILNEFLEHRNARIRSIAVVAIGNIAHPSSIDRLKKVLYDSEPNVQWGAAIALAKMNDSAGKNIILKMLDRRYLSAFPEVDPEEQNHLLLSAIEAASLLHESELDEQLKRLSKSDHNMKIRAAALEKFKQ